MVCGIITVWSRDWDVSLPFVCVATGGHPPSTPSAICFACGNELDFPSTDSLDWLREKELNWWRGSLFSFVFLSKLLSSLFRGAESILACGAIKGNGNWDCELSFSLTVSVLLVFGLVFPGISVSSGLEDKLFEGALGGIDETSPAIWKIYI